MLLCERCVDCGDQIVTSVDVHNNIAVNNDVGISMENYNAACGGASTVPTKNRAYNNNVTNNAVTNAYQAGIADVGNLDQIGNNKISGKGYALLPTDFTSAINPKTSRNRYRP